MELGDIQRGRGGSFNLGGTGSKVLRVWNFASTLLSSAVGVSLSGNTLCPRRYWAWQHVGRCSRHDLIEN